MSYGTWVVLALCGLTRAAYAQQGPLPAPSAPPLILAPALRTPLVLRREPGAVPNAGAAKVVGLEAVVEPVHEPRVGASFKLFAGAGHRALYGVSYFGLDLGVFAGKNYDSWANYANLMVFVGRSAAGIQTTDLRVAYTAEAQWGLFRIGGGPQTALLLLRRATTGGLISIIGLGIRGHGTFDLTDGARGAVVFAGLTAGAAVYLAGPSVMYDVGVGVGVRL